MRVLDARILTWGSTRQPHHLEILVDSIHRDDKVYDVIEDERGATYLSVTDGIVSFYYHNPKDENGYGGSVFNLAMRDGSERAIKGPWSSNNAWIRQVFGIDSFHVSYTEDPEVFKRGYTFYSGDITLEKAQEAMKLVGDEWQLIYASSNAKVPNDASGEQAAIIEGSLEGWYIVRENCPDNYKTEKYLWPEVSNKYNNQRLVDRATEELDPTMCLNGWHRKDWRTRKEKGLV